MPKPHRHQATWAPRMSIPTSISLTASHGSNRVRIACGVLLPQTQISPCITTNVRRLFLPPTFPHRVRATSLPAVLAALAHADATTCLDIDLDLHAATILDKRVARLRPTICCAPARLTVIRADFFVFLLGAPAQFLRTATLAAHMRDPYRHTAVPSHNTAIKFVECLSGPQWAKGRKGCHSPVMFGGPCQMDAVGQADANRIADRHAERGQKVNVASSLYKVTMFQLHGCTAPPLRLDKRYPAQTERY